jgi:hypothetical protein
VNGTLSAGHRLEGAPGTWTSASTLTYAYQWHRCNAAGAHCTSVHGATAAGYTLTAVDVDKVIGLTVTVSDPSGSAVAYASLVGPIAGVRPLLVSTAQPQVTGLPVEGKLLQVTTGAWSPMPERVTYGWERCNANGRICASIQGANASSYTVAALDVGHALLARVTGTFGQATQPTLSTATTVAIGGDVAGPSRTSPPAVEGTAQRGAQLTGSAGSWIGVGSLVYRYQWYRCDDHGAHCATIRGATLSTYRTVRADIDKTIGFTVHATDSSGTTTAYASLVGPIVPKKTPAAFPSQPTLTGSARPGAALEVDVATAPGQAFQWQRCNANGRLCEPIAGATRAAYTLSAADVGHTIAVLVSTGDQSIFSTASPLVA